MAKKKKKKLRMPPLSLLDKTIYGVFAIFGAVLIVSISMLPFFYRMFFAFSDVQVIACRDRASILFAIPLGLYLLVTVTALFERGYTCRIPIFGKRGIKYGPPDWQPVYPIFMKNRPHRWVSKNAKEMRWFSIKIWLAGFVICLAFYPLSFFGRTCLMRDGRILEYNAFNLVTEEHLPEQMKSVTFDTCKLSVSSGSRRLWLFHDSRWACKIQVTVSDGETYSFTQREFEDQWEALDELVQIKAQYPPEILRYEGTEQLDEVATDHYYTREETQMLYELFGVPAADYPWYIQ